MNDNFYAGQSFSGSFPPEAAVWCNRHNVESAVQLRIEPRGDGFVIAEVPPEADPTPEELLQGYEDAVQQHLDKTAQTRGYDNTYTCLSYISSTDAKWYREANAFNAWRDSVWRTCHVVLEEYLSGAIARPTREELLARLPVIDWQDPEGEE